MEEGGGEREGDPSLSLLLNDGLWDGDFELDSLVAEGMTGRQWRKSILTTASSSSRRKNEDEDENVEWIEGSRRPDVDLQREVFPIREKLISGEVKYFAAPLVRWSKLPFRLLCRRWGCDVAFTSMIVAEDFNASASARKVEFVSSEDDRPLVVQFAAKTPEALASATEKVIGACDAIDINCGCPQRWAIQEGIGSALLQDSEKLKNMIRSAKEVSGHSLPVSVKVRLLDFNDDFRNTIDLCKKVESVGVEWITLHGRTPKQKSTSPVNLEAIKLVKSAITVPLIANGDIFTLEDAERTIRETGVNGVMAARGILQNPGLFKRGGGDVASPECIMDFIDLCLTYGAPFRYLHQILIYMLSPIHSKQEKQYFNGLRTIPAILDFFENRKSIC